MNSLQRKLRRFYLYAKQCVATRKNKSFWHGKQAAYREIQKWNEVKEVNDWIPVEKRYPTQNGWYQCTCDDRKVGEIIWENHTIVRDLFWNSSRKEFIDNIRYAENGYMNLDNYFWTKYVTAWQPLPKPYNQKIYRKNQNE